MIRHLKIARDAAVTRKHPQPFDPRVYEARNIIERTIGGLKDWRAPSRWPVQVKS